MRKRILNWLCDFGLYLISLLPRTTFYITSSVAAAGFVIYFAAKGTMEPWQVWALLSVALFLASFHSWREQASKNYGLLNRLKPKLKLYCSVDVPGCFERDFHAESSTIVHRVVVESDADVDVEECRGVITAIRRGEEVLMEGRNVYLTFQPSENPDSQNKCIRRKARENLDVVFMQLHEGKTINLLPATKDNKWIGSVSFYQRFGLPGEYEFDLRIEAKDMDSICKTLRFTLDNESSKLEFA